MARVAQEPREAEEVRDINVGAQRMCVIRLHESYVDFNGDPKVLKLSWNTGKPSPTAISRPVRKTLRPGEQMRTTLERAQAWFGMFTIPFVLESVYDQNKRDSLLEQYDHERQRAIMTWGEYPRGQATGPDNNGGQVIGPARIPPVMLVVEDADGTQWDPIDLRDLYEVGEFFEPRPLRTVYQRPENNEAKEREVSELRERTAKLEGMLLMYAQQHPAAPQTKKGQQSPAPPPVESLQGEPA